MATITERTAAVTLAAALATSSGANHLTPAEGPSTPPANAPALAPEARERA